MVLLAQQFLEVLEAVAVQVMVVAQETQVHTLQ
jgi:hypothetical protein